MKGLKKRTIHGASASRPQSAVFGKGDRAGDAQHLAAEFLGQDLSERAPMPALALNANSSAVTAIGNNYGFDQVFARQLAARAQHIMRSPLPKVSIGLPVYNGEKYLANALTHLLSQEFEDFELIVSDNASTDATQAICHSFAENDTRIRYFRNPTNIGLGANHNRTFELSRGKFFKWVAYDDDFPRAMLARFVSVFENEPPYVSVVCSYCEYIDERGDVIGVDSDHLQTNHRRPHRRLWNLLRNLHMYGTIYGLIRSDVLRKTRLHGLYPIADKVLLAELAMLGTFVEIPEPLLRIRQHPGRTFTANKSPEALRDIFTPTCGRRYQLLSIQKHMELELIRSAILIPVAWRDKILCSAVAVVKPQWETFRAFGGRQKQRLFQMFRPAAVRALKKGLRRYRRV